MVNAPPTTERRSKARVGDSAAAEAAVLGTQKLNPFGDLHTLQHLSARLARGLRPVWETLLRREVRSFAEPLSVQRFADYRAERGDLLTAWLPLAMTPGVGQGSTNQAWCVIDGRFLIELLDLFFGGAGVAPLPMPADFSPAADAMAVRIAGMFADALGTAWEPLTRVSFAADRMEQAADIDGEDAVIVTRVGVDTPGQPMFVDILYPVVALKPHGATLTGKVLDKAERNALARATMGVRFPVRSVLAEPIVPLSMLMELKAGDVIPIAIAPDVPVMVGRDRLGCGTVGTSNGRAAIRLTSLAHPDISDEGLNS
jgi:flagellar motor switch protein FliM